jgi:hypothetical protein
MGASSEVWSKRRSPSSALHEVQTGLSPPLPTKKNEKEDGTKFLAGN